jgi:hypothetical protein
MVTLNDKFDQLKSLNEALKGLSDIKTETGSSSCFTSLAVAADIKALRMGLQVNENMTYLATESRFAVPRRQDLLEDLERLSRVKLHDFKPMKNYEAMCAARYDEETVFVEWKAINPHLRSKILPRAQNLAALLNLPKDISFRSLHCRGTIEMDDKVAFVFRHPSPDAGDLPRSLKDLFGAKDGMDPPSLTDRIQFALSIAQSINSFHRAGWLHKDLRSEIYFFSRPKTASILKHQKVKYQIRFSLAFLSQDFHRRPRYRSNLLWIQNEVSIGILVQWVSLL